jgi:hypothetical protein
MKNCNYSNNYHSYPDFQLSLFFKSAWSTLVTHTTGEGSKIGNSEKIPFIVPKDLKNENHDEFYQLMCNRMKMGAFRYGLLREKNYTRYDLLNELIRRTQRFHVSRNLEDLVDIGNLTALAYRYFKEKGYHFKSVDDGEHATLIGDSYVTL